MGWTYSNRWQSFDAVVAELCDPQLNGDYHILHVEKTPTGMWSILRGKATGRAFLTINLISGDKQGFGYKDIDVGMGPYCYDCSLETVNRAITAGVDFTSPDAAAWLDRWTEAHMETT